MEEDLTYIEDIENLTQDREKLQHFVGKNYIHINYLKQLKNEYINDNIRLFKDELLLRKEIIEDFIKYIEERS